jgi:RNA polymerase sigma factor (sigma-70 family)
MEANMSDDVGGMAAKYKANGNETAFEAVLSACEPLIARYSYWLGQQDRMDAAQELRICVLEAIRNWDGQRPFMAFAGCVLYRNAVVLLQRQQMQRRIETVSLDSPSGDEGSWHEIIADGNAAMPGAAAELDDDATKAMAILGSHKLSASKKKSFLLTAVLGKTYRQAAKIQKCNVKKVDNQIAEVRRKIRGTNED